MNMSMVKRLKSSLLNQPVFREAWGAYRQWQLHHNYASRREYYAKLANEQDLVYCESEIIRMIRERLAARGYFPAKRRLGEIHTFAFVPNIGWHCHLIPDLEELGTVTVFDYVALGYSWEEFAKADKIGISRRKEMNEKILPALQKAHAMHPVDWVFVYASGLEISASTIRQITNELGIPTVNMCLDDKNSWTGKWMGDHHAGQVDIAAEFDISWTSARVACEWYLVEGARPVYMPEGFDMKAYHPLPVEQDIPVSFVGEAYGFRQAVVRYLRKYGIPIQVFGSGWGGTGRVENIVEIFNRSIINIGMGGIGYSESLTNVKGRDFEIPGVGRGVYLTSFNPDMAQHFVVGKEILCYRNRDEMLELIRYYLAHPEEAREIAIRGRERCLREHRWLHRYQRICQILGILAE